MSNQSQKTVREIHASLSRLNSRSSVAIAGSEWAGQNAPSSPLSGHLLISLQTLFPLRARLAWWEVSLGPLGLLDGER